MRGESRILMVLIQVAALPPTTLQMFRPSLESLASHASRLTGVKTLSASPHG
jgi:hypothetical protein